MHKVQLTKGKAKHEVVFYDSARNLPARRYHKFNKYMAIDLEVGDSIAAYDNRMARAIQYLNSDDKKSAGIELTNQRQCLYNILQEYSPKGMALAVMVYSIDGKVYEDYDGEVLNEILDRLDELGFTKGMLDDTVSHVKKKLKKI